MAQYLLIDEATNRLELAPDVNLDDLRDQLEDATREDTVVGVRCVLADGPSRTCVVMVRPAYAARWALV